MKKYKCKNTIRLEGSLDPVEPIVFEEGKIYQRVKAEIYPSADALICLIDETNEEHFMDGKWLNENFELVPA